ncbi:hypothetical protein LXL04_013683 [Taraxacum kok-saghyz]
MQLQLSTMIVGSYLNQQKPKLNLCLVRKVTIKLLEKAILENGIDKFLIDGSSRNEENRAPFELIEETEKHFLGGNQGRDDDDIDIIRKLFKVFLESREGLKVDQICSRFDSSKPVGEVFEAVKDIFTSVIQDHFLDVISVNHNIFGLVLLRFPSFMMNVVNVGEEPILKLAVLNYYGLIEARFGCLVAGIT